MRVRSLMAGVAATLIAGTAVSAAFAGGSIKDAPLDDVRVFSWRGFYIGAHAAHSSVDSKATSSLPNGAFILNQSIHDKHFGGGAEVGYNFQSGNVVYGLALDWTHLGTNGIGIVDPVGLDEFYRVRVSNMFTARGRLGYAFGNFLPYLTAGLAVARIGAGYENYTDATRTVLEETSFQNSTRTGWVAGIGADIAFTDRIIGKIEWLHADFGSFNNTTFPAAVPGETLKFRTSVNLLKFGLGVKF